MHQKAFVDQAPPGPAGGELKRSPDALAAILGLLLRGGEGKEVEERGGKGEEEGKEREKGSFCVHVYAPVDA